MSRRNIAVIPILLLAGMAQAENTFCQDSATRLISDGMLIDQIRYAVPQEHASAVSEIEFLFTDAGLAPFATVTNGSPQVFIPITTIESMCELIVANRKFTASADGVNRDDISDMLAFFDEVWPAAAQEYQQCLQAQEQENCFLNMTRVASQMADQQAANRGVLIDPEFSQEAQVWVDFLTLKSGMQNLIMHEVAHHLLEHFDRYQAGVLTRAEAEREADDFSFETASALGQVGIGYGSYFNALERVNAEMPSSVTSFYESWDCRAGAARAYDHLTSPAFFILLTGIRNRYSGEALADELEKAILEREFIIDSFENLPYPQECLTINIDDVLAFYDDGADIIRYIISHQGSFFGADNTGFPKYALREVFALSELPTNRPSDQIKSRIMLATLINWFTISGASSDLRPQELGSMMEILQFISAHGYLGDSLVAKDFLSEDTPILNNISAEQAFSTFMNEYKAQ